MVELAIIGGTGLQRPDELRHTHQTRIKTPYGAPSAAITFGQIADKQIAYLPRHGAEHTIPPHRINYRANIWALKEIGAQYIIGVAAVGGIHSDLGPSVIVVPDQLIDYTYGRTHTFSDTEKDPLNHIDFTFPYSQLLRTRLLDASQKADITVVNNGCYAATQGPRLETAAEINRLERDGCSIVGMTGMPEAALARELSLEYASLCVVANFAAGRSGQVISMDQIEQDLAQGMVKVQRILQQLAISTFA